MSLVSLVGALIVAGVALWLINKFIPKGGKIKVILNIVVVICILLWLLLGVLSPRDNSSGCFYAGGRWVLGSPGYWDPGEKICP